MTVMLIRKCAKDFAGAFYEMNRSARFRQAFPDQREYIKHHWIHFVQEAKNHLVDMMNRSTTPAHIKQEIYDALTENFERGQKAKSRENLKIHQTTLERPEEKQGRKML